MASKLAKGATGVAISVMIATGLIMKFEGHRNTAYLAPEGKWTICWGHTGPEVHDGLTLSDAECKAILERDMAWAFAAVDSSVKVPISEEVRGAMASFAYNVGKYAFQNSSLLKRINSGDMAGACNALLDWMYITRKVKLDGLIAARHLGFTCEPKPYGFFCRKPLEGLVNRREAEKAVCLQ